MGQSSRRELLPLDWAARCGLCRIPQGGASWRERIRQQGGSQRSARDDHHQEHTDEGMGPWTDRQWRGSQPEGADTGCRREQRFRGE